MGEASHEAIGVVAEFFRSGVPFRWLETWGVSPSPAAMALNANGELVVANGDRSLMAVLFHSEEDGLFVVHLYDDPVAMIDPDAEATDGSCHETVAAAFDAATDLIGCAIGRQPSPTA